MNRLTARSVTVIGLAGVIAIVLIGVLVALPLYLSATATHEQADRIVETNGLQQTRIELLDRESQRMAELSDEVAGLRAQIPDAPHLDQVVERVVVAADRVGARVDSLSTSDPVPFAPRTREVIDGAVGESTESVRQQIEITARVVAPSSRELAAFLEGVRTAGPRLAAVTSAHAEPTEPDIALTVTFLVFIDTTGAAR